MKISQLGEECLWFARTYDPDLPVQISDKSLGSVEPSEIKIGVLESGERALTLVTDRMQDTEFPVKLSLAIFDVIKTNEFDKLLSKQLEKDFGQVAYLNRLAATVMGVVTSDEFSEVLKEKLKV